MHPAMMFLAECAVGMYDLWLAGIFRMNGKVHADPVAAAFVEVLKKFQGFCDLRIIFRLLSRCKALDTAAKIGFHSGLIYSGGSFPREKIHIGETGGAGGDHFQQSQAACSGNMFGV